MTARFILELECAYCGHMNEEILYAFEAGEWFACRKCRKRNGVTLSFRAKKMNKEG